MHGACGQHEDAAQAHGARALLNALEDALAIALPLALRRDGQCCHFGRFGLRVGVERGAAKDHAVVLDHGVLAGIALDLGAVALDQRTILFERLDQLQDATDVIDGGLAQALEFFVDHHGADAIVHIHLEQQGAVGGKGQDMGALDASFAGAHAVLKIKGGIGGLLGLGQLGQQPLGQLQRHLGVDRVVFALGLARLDADARHFGQENQLVGLQLDGHARGHLFHGQIEGFARDGKTKGRQQHHGAHVQGLPYALHIDLAYQPRVFEVDPVDDAHGPRGDEVARNHPHG